MNIRIGFSDQARDVAVTVDKDQESVLADINAALDSGEGLLRLTDKHGAVTIARVDKIAWVEVGPTKPTHVGFAVGSAD